MLHLKVILLQQSLLQGCIVLLHQLLPSWYYKLLVLCFTPESSQHCKITEIRRNI